MQLLLECIWHDFKCTGVARRVLKLISKIERKPYKIETTVYHVIKTINKALLVYNIMNTALFFLSFLSIIEILSIIFISSHISHFIFRLYTTQ